MTPEGMAVLNGDDAMSALWRRTLSQVVFCGRLTGPYAAKEIRQLGPRGCAGVITPKNDFFGDRARVGRPYMIYLVAHGLRHWGSGSAVGRR